MNIDALEKQMRFARWLRRQTTMDLRRLHKKKFIGTQWWIYLPQWVTRYTIIQRLFYLFCIRHYHEPKDSHTYQIFYKRASAYLSPKNLGEIRKEDEARVKLKEFHIFSRRNIDSMPIVEVDRYLAAMNIFIDGDQATRRKILWEMFNLRQKELIDTNTRKGEKKRRRRHGKLNNQLVLRDLILNNPEMCYESFRLTFGEVMPTVTSDSFRNARYLLRKAGYSIPKLRSGPALPAIVINEEGSLQAIRAG